MPDDSRLPAIPQTPRSLEDVGGSALPPSLQILLDEGLYTRMKQLSGLMSKADGFTPRHLLGKPEACFAIINTSLDWKLNPHFVARHTYQTPGGSIGFDGALVQSVLERSGRFVGAPEFEYRGDWEKLTGMFEKKTSSKDKEYIAAIWTDQDATGLGIIVRWQVRGESKPRVWPGETTPFWLTQCYPRNSPLWATDPKTQIAYLAIRRFANLASPGILGAASFDYDDMVMAGDLARDVTPPRPRPEDYATAAVSEPESEQTETGKVFEVFDFSGEAHEYPTEEAAIEALEWLIAAARTLRALDGLTESNQTWAKYPSIIEAFKEQKEALTAQPSDTAQVATSLADTEDQHHAALIAKAGQTEHPRGTTSTPTPERTQELPAADMATQHAAAQPNNRPWDTASKVAQHAPRDEAFWSKNKFQLPGEKPKEILYYLSQYLRQCRDLFDVNGLEADNAARFEQPADRREAEQMIAGRRKEIGGAKA